MPESPTNLARLLELAELDEDQLSPADLEQLVDLLATASADPTESVAKGLLLRRKLATAKRSCARTTEAASELEAILEKLLEAGPIFCRIESFREDLAGPRAMCRINGQLRELPLHPSVDATDVASLEPWEYVCVHPEELVVIGTSRPADFLPRARGEVAEFRGYFGGRRDQAHVARPGHDEGIVSLAGTLRDVELAPGDKLVLLRDDERWAIDRIQAEDVRSKFEVSIDGLDTKFTDLAGLDSIIEPLLEDVILRVLHPELREEFALRPLHGLLLFSYKPGMGKTAMMRALAVWLDELGREQGFDVVLYVVQPNELKIVWHGGDAKIVREELCGAIRARQAAPRTRPLFQICVLDEIDSLGKRGGSMDGGPVSGASDDAVQALLAEMDGMIPSEKTAGDGPPAHVIWCGLTNRPDMLDEALKRPKRFGDFVREIPAADRDAVGDILAIHARGDSTPWSIDGEIRCGVSSEDLRANITRPAVAAVFDQVVLRYSTDGRAGVEATAGDVMASVHFMEAMNVAKKQAARRKLDGVGLPAVTLDDVVEGLVDQACAAAGQMDADRAMFRRQMKISERVTRVDLVPEQELRTHRYTSLNAV